MTINFQNVGRSILAIPKTARLESFAKGLPTSDKITGVEIRISKVFIKDNKTARIPPFIRYSDLYFILITADDMGGEPQTITMKGFADVDDGEQLPVERTVYYWKAKDPNDKAPGQIHLLISIIKSNEGIRDTGKALAALRQTDDFKSVIKAAVTAATSAATGGTGALIVEGLTALAGVLGSVLGNVDDTPLITTVVSFTDINGMYDALGKHSSVQSNRYVDIEMSAIIRDTSREPQ